MAFTRFVIQPLKNCFEGFLKNAQNENRLDTTEYALPLAIDELIKNKRISVEVLKTHDKWYGMTHKEDCPEIIAAFADMIKNGQYPSPLFD